MFGTDTITADTILYAKWTDAATPSPRPTYQPAANGSYISNNNYKVVYNSNYNSIQLYYSENGNGVYGGGNYYRDNSPSSSVVCISLTYTSITLPLIPLSGRLSLTH